MMFVYILSSGKRGTLYIGVTNDLIKRVHQHKTKAVPSFTNRYDIDQLVYFEQFDDPENAIRREKRLKAWNRAWKSRLIERFNPEWRDLYLEIWDGAEVNVPQFLSLSAKADNPAD
jgi:putative endonuclease